MSVEEARQGVFEAIAISLVGDMDGGFGPAIDAAIDRLILEVQATFGCVVCLQSDCTEDCGCPSCTARMKLEETADAP